MDKKSVLGTGNYKDQKVVQAYRLLDRTDKGRVLKSMAVEYGMSYYTAQAKLVGRLPAKKIELMAMENVIKKLGLWPE